MKTNARLKKTILVTVRLGELSRGAIPQALFVVFVAPIDGLSVMTIQNEREGQFVAYSELQQRYSSLKYSH